MGLRSFSLHPSSQSALSPWPQAVPKTLHATQFPGLSPASPQPWPRSLAVGWWPEGREVSEGLCLPGGVEHLGLEQAPPPWLVRCDKK